jgi:betaine-aldehyde dehydrogenase
VIFPDADLESAADAVVFGVYFNVGQCCNSGSRIIVHEDIAEAFTARVVELSRQVAFGDPLDPATQVGAIVTPRTWGEDRRLCRRARARPGPRLPWRRAAAGAGPGAAVLPADRGDRRHPDMAIARDEVFGPVLTVLTFRTLDEALQP